MVRNILCRGRRPEPSQSSVWPRPSGCQASSISQPPTKQALIVMCDNHGLTGFGLRVVTIGLVLVGSLVVEVCIAGEASSATYDSDHDVGEGRRRRERKKKLNFYQFSGAYGVFLIYNICWRNPTEYPRSW